MGNLIEQLGGYEKTKEYLKENSRFMSFEALESFYDALLDYRQQHNIFEVGDKVVEITDYPSNDVLTVKSISDNLLMCESYDLSASYVLSNKSKPYFYIRHATTEEITAGRIS